jgi:hypothetical protein
MAAARFSRGRLSVCESAPLFCGRTHASQFCGISAICSIRTGVLQMLYCDFSRSPAPETASVRGNEGARSTRYLSQGTILPLLKRTCESPERRKAAHRSASGFSADLFRRRRRKDFRSAARLWFRLGLGRFLGFFLAFVLVSHASKCAINQGPVNSGEAAGNRVRYFSLSAEGACPRRSWLKIALNTSPYVPRVSPR